MKSGEKKALVVINLGSPDSTSVKDVRRYLREFLMDPEVIQIFFLLRFILVYFIISIFRAKKSAQAYKEIWDAKRGSPLKYLTEDFSNHLGEFLKKERANSADPWWSRGEVQIHWSMRYGNPSIKDTLMKIKKDNISCLRILPMYPQFADSSFKTVVNEVSRWGKEIGFEKLEIYIPFFSQTFYLDALADSIKNHFNAESKGVLLFSYHGLPEKHITKYNENCLKESCCESPGRALNKCYKAQSAFITKEVSQRLGLSPGVFQMAFQSRLSEGWIRPFTDKVIVELGQRRLSKLTIVCPSFTVDCLETIEEIGIQAKQNFEAAGGQSFQRIPCLNTEKNWVESIGKGLLHSSWGQSPEALN